MVRLVGLKEVAETLGVAEGTLRNWCWRREIPYVKAGRLVKFDPADVERYIARRKRGSGCEG